MSAHAVRPHAYRWISAALALAGAVAAADGQELEHVARSAAGPVRLAYPAAENVCGAGDGIVIREPDGSTMFVSGRVSRSDWERWREGESPCRTGDVMVRMRADGAGWSDVRVGFGPLQGDDVAVTDLGYVTGQAAAELLLDAARVSGSRSARDLVLAAAIAADAEIWPELLAMARDRALPSRVRESALHWLGRRAAREAVKGLGGIVRDRTEEDRIREAAVFALSQLPDDQAIPLLIEVVRTMDDPRVVNRALFWLAEFDDPRAMALFEEILSPASTPHREGRTGRATAPTPPPLHGRPG